MDPVVAQLLLLIVTLWSIFWKGIALWRAGRSGQINWFLAILILSTFGIIELVYLFKFAKTPLTIEQIKAWKNVFNQKRGK